MDVGHAVGTNEQVLGGALATQALRIAPADPMPQGRSGRCCHLKLWNPKAGRRVNSWSYCFQTMP